MKVIYNILIIILFTACNKPIRRNNEIIKIEFVRMGNRFVNGAAITIDSSLVYNYVLPDTTKFNYYSGKITPDFWDTVNIKMEQINYKKFADFDSTSLYGTLIECCAYKIIITYKGGKKYMWKSIDDTSRVLPTLHWLNLTFKSVKLHPTAKSIPLERDILTIMPRSPKPKKDNIKFPPPNKN